MSASHYKLDNLTAIVDRNRLQIDGYTKDIMKLEPLTAKWASFGWDVLECDGHNIKELIDTFEKAKEIKGRPVVIIAHTVKGKCISYAEEICSYHSMALKDGIEGDQSLNKAIEDI